MAYLKYLTNIAEQISINISIKESEYVPVYTIRINETKVYAGDVNQCEQFLKGFKVGMQYMSNSLTEFLKKR